VALSATFIVLTIAEFSESTSITKVGGWLGLITAVVAWYASFAVVTNATWKRPIIPLFPLTGAFGAGRGGPVEGAHS